MKLYWVLLRCVILCSAVLRYSVLCITALRSRFCLTLHAFSRALIFAFKAAKTAGVHWYYGNRFKKDKLLRLKVNVTFDVTR